MFKFCSLFSGSSGNCLFAGDEKTKILIDAGVSGRRIEGALSQIGESCGALSAILVTHEHQDHIAGAGILARRYGIPVYATQKTWEAIDNEKLLGKLPNEYRRVVNTGESINMESIKIKAYHIPHDAADPVAYTLSSGGHKISIATDIGHVTEEIRKSLTGSELVLVEANHDVEMLRAGKYPYNLKRRILSDTGHLSNEAAAELICELVKKGTGKFILGHLSAENNYPKLAYQTVLAELKMRGLSEIKDLYIAVADRDCVSEAVVL